jgi:hypothetical protein
MGDNRGRTFIWRTFHMYSKAWQERNIASASCSMGWLRTQQTKYTKDAPSSCWRKHLQLRAKVNGSYTQSLMHNFSLSLSLSLSFSRILSLILSLTHIHHDWKKRGGKGKNELALLVLQAGYTGGNIFIYSRFVSLGAIAVFLFLSLFLFFMGHHGAEAL